MKDVNMVRAVCIGLHEDLEGDQIKQTCYTSRCFTHRINMKLIEELNKTVYEEDELPPANASQELFEYLEP